MYVGDRVYPSVAIGLAKGLLQTASTRSLAEDLSVGRNPAELASPEHAKQLMAGYDPGKATPPGALNPPAVERPENPWATSFLVVDAQGNAVACNIHASKDLRTY